MSTRLGSIWQRSTNLFDEAWLVQEARFVRAFVIQR